MSESRFIRQPSDSPPLGEVLLAALADTAWTTVWASVAYVKISGVKHLSGPLQDFGMLATGDSKLVVGREPLFRHADLAHLSKCLLSALTRDLGPSLHGVR